MNPSTIKISGGCDEMRIANNVEMLELKTILANGPGVINPLIVWDEKDVILFDAGLPGMGTIFCETALSACVPYGRLNKVLITHSDMDHIGSLSQIIKEAGTAITLMAHKEEKPYIECDIPPIRVRQMEASARNATGILREQLITMTEKLKKNYRMFRTNVDKTIEDGEVLPFCGGITCIYTPGHTPGHMSYYLKSLKMLIAGDILQVINGSLEKSPDFTTIDKEAQAVSLKKLCNYEIDRVVCYHGGLFQDDASHRIAEIANGICS
jgi:glyoxylase-like metal-dependent hydrolase (beta-lactamase superfamily II)